MRIWKADKSHDSLLRQWSEGLTGRVSYARMAKLLDQPEETLAGVYLIGETDAPQMATCVWKRGEEYHLVWVGGVLAEESEDFTHYLRQFFAQFLYQYKHGNAQGDVNCLTRSDYVVKVALEAGFEIYTELLLYRKQGTFIPHDLLEDEANSAMDLPLTIRHCRLEELDELVRLEQQIFMPEIWTHREAFREIMKNPDGCMQVAICVGQLVGYHYHRVLDGQQGQVVRLGVHPDYQGLGIGKQLLKAGMEWFAEKQVDAIILYVEERNLLARGLYAKFGFGPEAKEIMLRYEKE